jgi:hypothetical protein
MVNLCSCIPHSALLAVLQFNDPLRLAFRQVLANIGLGNISFVGGYIHGSGSQLEFIHTGVLLL